ncbi:PREDICTED: uncharacterized protein LOC109383574 [Hipposideros armiger]|uniref:Uncharacterized protein LOC109383574 n=1 Tax=Hipposideros armiger TaxID=186990 RepID=A0A8B7RK32_HIPAR|nr:PREDICTED: uncharacterized protein LOC109383574 [Hipposideros armiger]
MCLGGLTGGIVGRWKQLWPVPQGQEEPGTEGSSVAATQTPAVMLNTFHTYWPPAQQKPLTPPYRVAVCLQEVHSQDPESLLAHRCSLLLIRGHEDILLHCFQKAVPVLPCEARVCLSGSFLSTWSTQVRHRHTQRRWSWSQATEPASGVSRGDDLESLHTSIPEPAHLTDRLHQAADHLPKPLLRPHPEFSSVLPLPGAAVRSHELKGFVPATLPPDQTPATLLPDIPQLEGP